MANSREQMIEIAGEMSTEELVREYGNLSMSAGRHGYFALQNHDREALDVVRKEVTQRLSQTEVAVSLADRGTRSAVCELNPDEENMPHQDTLERICGLCGETETALDIEELETQALN